MVRVAAFWLCALCLSASDASNRYEKQRYPSLEEGTSPIVILNARYELELRHAGGPRPDRVDKLLRLRSNLEDPGWGADVIKACKDRLIDCREYVNLAATIVGRDTEDSQTTAARKHTYDQIRREAGLQSMTTQQRRTLYSKAFLQRVANDGDVELDAWNAAERALDEAMYDLIGSIRKAESDWPMHGWDIIEDRHIKIAEALASSDSKRALLNLVRAGIPTRHGEPPEVTARVALSQLRRLNAPGTVEDLKALLELYVPAKEKQAWDAQEKAQRLGRALVASEMPSASAYLGFLGRNIVETIGDLGDREFEKKTLDGRTLWDQVNEVEIRLQKQGKLTASEMVSK